MNDTTAGQPCYVCDGKGYQVYNSYYGPVIRVVCYRCSGRGRSEQITTVYSANWQGAKVEVIVTKVV